MIRKFFIADGTYVPVVSCFEEDTPEYMGVIDKLRANFTTVVEVTERPDEYYVWSGSAWVSDLSIKRNEAIGYISAISFERRGAIIPDYKLVNASLGVYSESETQMYFDTVVAFRNEFYRLKGLIEAAVTTAEIDDIIQNQTQFPEQVVSHG